MKKVNWQLTLVALLAWMLVVAGLGVAPQSAYAYSTKQVSGRCVTGYQYGMVVYVWGWNQSNVYTGTYFGVDGNGYFYTTNWWYQGLPDGKAAFIQVQYSPGGTIYNKGTYTLSGGSSTYWNQIPVDC